MPGTLSYVCHPLNCILGHIDLDISKNDTNMHMLCAIFSARWPVTLSSDEDDMQAYKGFDPASRAFYKPPAQGPSSHQHHGLPNLGPHAVSGRGSLSSTFLPGGVITMEQWRHMLHIQVRCL